MSFHLLLSSVNKDGIELFTIHGSFSALFAFRFFYLDQLHGFIHFSVKIFNFRLRKANGIQPLNVISIFMPSQAFTCSVRTGFTYNLALLTTLKYIGEVDARGNSFI